MPDTERPDTDWDAWIDAMAPAMGLAIDPAHRPGVRQFLEIAADFAAVIETVPLDADELALLPVYTPPDTGPDPDPFPPAEAP
ncbi:MAG: DUF4089 domain-containing protein [Pseudomonadota bacterium]